MSLNLTTLIIQLFFLLKFYTVTAHRVILTYHELVTVKSLKENIHGSLAMGHCPKIIWMSQVTASWSLVVDFTASTVRATSCGISGFSRTLLKHIRHEDFSHERHFNEI